MTTERLTFIDPASSSLLQECETLARPPLADLLASVDWLIAGISQLMKLGRVRAIAQALESEAWTFTSGLCPSLGDQLP